MRRWLLSCLLLTAAGAKPALLDDFERDTPGAWQYSAPGTLDVVAGHAPGSAGAKVLRLSVSAALRNNRISWGELRLSPPPLTDWTPYTALTVWVRCTGGRRIHSLSLYAEDAGTRLESHHVVLPGGQWTKVVYPIQHLVRNQVGLFFFSHTAAGGLPGEALDEVYEFDDLQLEDTPPVPAGGWEVPAGLAAFAHTGYRPGEVKRIAFPAVPGAAGQQPQAIVRRGGQEVCRVDLRGGSVADITQVREPGTYTVEANGATTEPFRIAEDAWVEPARAVLRFLDQMRCGTAVDDPLVGHAACHLDNCRPRVPDKLDPKTWPLAATHRQQLGDWFDLTGGWHDAGIIDQYTGNTGLITYALADLAQSRPAVAAQALDEAVWGGRWLVKACLATGDFVMADPGQAWWTDNQPRTADDRYADVQGSWPDHALKAVAGMARLAQALGDREPKLKADLLAAVRRAVHHYHVDVFPNYWGTQFQFLQYGALAGVEAYAATGDVEAAEFARFCLGRLLQCQDPRTGPGTGFFCTDIGRKHPYRFPEADGIAIVALVRAVGVMTDDPQAPAWREAVTRWSRDDALPRCAVSAGYGIAAFGLYDDDEQAAYDGKESWWASPWDPKQFLLNTGQDERELLRRALRVGSLRARIFGAHYGGNNRHLASTAAGLHAAARLLGNAEFAAAGDEQLQWIVGHNPLSACLMTHVGHRSPLAYETLIGDVTGAMYQGIGSQDGDTPFLSPACFYTQKEIWGVCGGWYLLAVAEGR